MAMRCLGYVSRTLENLAGKDGLYGEEMVKFPAPEFYCFYIGNEKWESRQLRLSESFLAKPKENSIELVVNIVNLNYNESVHNEIKDFYAHMSQLVCCDASQCTFIDT